jgi:putative flippase GtrA
LTVVFSARKLTKMTEEQAAGRAQFHVIVMSTVRKHYPHTLAFQPGKFTTVGVMNTMVDLGIYLIPLRVPALANLPVLAKACSYGCGILNSYFWNRSWTFRSRISIGRGLLLFIPVNLCALAVNAGVLYAALAIMDQSNFIALVLATMSTFGFNFIVSRRMVFRA